jgi:hypothetical protein
MMFFQISPKNRKMGAWNWWLWRVFGGRTLILDVLARNGFSQTEIDRFKGELFDPYVEALLDYIKQVEPGKDSARRHEVMLRHYGLVAGHRESLQAIANDYDLSRERIRQLVEKRLSVFRSEKGKADLEEAIVALARKTLDKA